MPQSATILQELQELNSSLAAPHTDGPGYVVPEGYFAGLAATILQRIKADATGDPEQELALLSPLLAGFSKKNPYTVPAGYFDELDPTFVLADDQDSRKELQQLSPLLGGLSRKSPFSVPDEYFAQSVSVPEKKQPVQAPVVRMTPTPKRWYRLAGAASIVVAVALGIAFWKTRPTGTSDAASYAWVEKNLKKVSTDDISKFVELAEPAAGDVAVADKTDDVKSLLKNVSDKEIQDFLKDVPVDETEDEDILFN